MPWRLAGSSIAFMALSACSGASVQSGMEAEKRGDWAGAMQNFRPLAETGDADAELELGILYMEGRGVAADGRQALLWLQRSAAQGKREAMENLGVLYQSGAPGIPSNGAEAVRWHLRAAQKGQSQAAYNLYVIYRTGLGVPEDHVQAARWGLVAAQDGEAGAQVNMAVHYAQGDGVAENPREAYRWAAIAMRSDDPRITAAAQKVIAVERPQLAPDQATALDKEIAAFRPNAS